MRMVNMFLGVPRRNEPIKLTDPRPLPRHTDNLFRSEDAGVAGFSVLSKSDPARQGEAPFVQGSEGFVHQGPDMSWEQ